MSEATCTSFAASMACLVQYEKRLCTEVPVTIFLAHTYLISVSLELGEALITHAVAPIASDVALFGRAHATLGSAAVDAGLESRVWRTHWKAVLHLDALPPVLRIYYPARRTIATRNTRPAA